MNKWNAWLVGYWFVSSCDDNTLVIVNNIIIIFVNSYDFLLFLLLLLLYCSLIFNVRLHVVLLHAYIYVYVCMCIDNNKILTDLCTGFDWARIRFTVQLDCWATWPYLRMRWCHNGWACLSNDKVSYALCVLCMYVCICAPTSKHMYLEVLYKFIIIFIRLLDNLTCEQSIRPLWLTYTLKVCVSLSVCVCVCNNVIKDFLYNSVGGLISQDYAHRHCQVY